MTDESMNSLEDLLDQHSYDMPQPGDIRIGVVVANTPQGLIIDLGLKRDGLVPQSDLAKLEPEEREALKVNDEVPVYIVQTEDPESLIVSIHLARLNHDWIQAEALLASGEIFEGEVIGYNKGGVIVPYGRIRGFVPISHLSDVTPGMGERRRQQRLARLRGETIGVKIIEVDRHRHRLVMSQREAQKEWEEKKRGELMETLQPGEVRTGRVSGMRDFGAFVDLGGADGLVHISELSWHRIDHPREVVKLGDEVEVYVLGVDQESGRISLSRKKLMPNPWDTVAQRYVQNQLVEGKVTRILDYGAFAEIEPGVEGLLHVSQLSRNPVEDPRAVVQEGEVHLLRIVSIDQKRQRIGLSLKAVTPTEQIEWMAQKELAEALRQEEEDAAKAARGSATPAEMPAPAEEPVAPAPEVIEAPPAEPVTASAEEVAEESVADAEESIADVTQAVEEAPDEAVEAAAGVGLALDEALTSAAEAASGTADAVESVADEAIDAVSSTVDEVEAVADDAADAAGDLVDEVETMGDDAADTAGSMVDEIEELADDGLDAAAEVADGAQAAVDDALASADDLVDDVDESVAETADAAEEAVDEAIAEAAESTEEVEEAAAEENESIVEKVQDAVESVMERVESFIADVTDADEAADETTSGQA